MSAPLADLQGPIGPDFTRPKHKRTATGFGPQEIKNIEASIPEPQREAWRKFVSCSINCYLRSSHAKQSADAPPLQHEGRVPEGNGPPH